MDTTQEEIVGYCAIFLFFFILFIIELVEKNKNNFRNWFWSVRLFLKESFCNHEIVLQPYRALSDLSVGKQFVCKKCHKHFMKQQDEKEAYSHD